MPLVDLEARRAYGKARYQERKEEIKERVNRYRNENPEKNKTRCREYYHKNKDLISVATKAKRAESAEEIRAKDREQYARNAEKRRQQDKCRYEKEAERRKRQANAHRRAHPDQRSDAQQRRRALKAGAPAERVLRLDILNRDGPNCALCGTETIQPIYKNPNSIDRHYDHIVPLSRGGIHAMSNLRILCAHCNLRKKSRLDSEFLAPSITCGIPLGDNHAS